MKQSIFTEEMMFFVNYNVNTETSLELQEYWKSVTKSNEISQQGQKVSEAGVHYDEAWVSWAIYHQYVYHSLHGTYLIASTPDLVAAETESGNTDWCFTY